MRANVIGRKKLINEGVLSNTNLNTCIPDDTKISNTENQSPEFKTEFRKIIKDWNKFRNVKHNRVKVYVNNKLPCIQVNVHKNLIVNTLLDTGASQNFITHDLYKQLNKLKVVKSLTNWKGTMFAANNSEINVLGKCKFKIKIGAFTWREEFLVMKHDNYDMILGMPFMSNKGLIIDLEKNVCYFKYKPEK